MEVYAFDIDNVEEMLYDILHALKVLTLAAGGLRNDELITDDELCAFEYVIRDAACKCGKLLEGLHPVGGKDGN